MERVADFIFEGSKITADGEWSHESWFIEAPDAGRDWGQEEKGMTEDKMAVWHHWLDGQFAVWETFWNFHRSVE